MRLGALLPVDAERVATDPRAIADCARDLEDLGYTSVWVFDCIGRGHVCPDPLVMLGVIAMATEHVEIATGIVQVPLRQTTLLAHQVMSAHLITGDRLLLGVGYGSTKADFDAMELDYTHRRTDFDRQMPVLEALLKSGKHANADLSPWPLRDRAPRILLGTWGRQVRTAAEHYDGWIASGHYRTNEELAASLALFREAGGKRAIVTNISLEDEQSTGRVATRVAELKLMGFDDAIVFAPHAALAEIRSLVPVD